MATQFATKHLPIHSVGLSGLLYAIVLRDLSLEVNFEYCNGEKDT